MRSPQSVGFDVFADYLRSATPLPSSFLLHLGTDSSILQDAGSTRLWTFEANCHRFASLESPDVAKNEQKAEWCETESGHNRQSIPWAGVPRLCSMIPKPRFDIYKRFEAEAELTMQNVTGQRKRSATTKQLKRKTQTSEREGMEKNAKYI